jgi:hypothetical protein
MNWEALGALAELAGALGVLITLIYLSVQIRRSSEDTRNNTIFSIMAMQADNRRSTMVSGVATVVTKVELGHSLEVEEERLLNYYEQSNLQDFEAAFVQFQAGTLPSDVMQSLDRRLSSVVSSMPGWSARWKKYRPMFTEKFAAHVDLMVGAPEESE